MKRGASHLYAKELNNVERGVGITSCSTPKRLHFDIYFETSKALCPPIVSSRWRRQYWLFGRANSTPTRVELIIKSALWTWPCRCNWAWNCRRLRSLTSAMWKHWSMVPIVRIKVPSVGHNLVPHVQIIRISTTLCYGGRRVRESVVSGYILLRRV